MKLSAKARNAANTKARATQMEGRGLLTSAMAAKIQSKARAALGKKTKRGG